MKADVALTMLLADPARAADVPPGERQAVLDALAVQEGRCRVLRDVLTRGLAPVPEAVGTSDRLLTVEEAAARLGLSADWLYRHAKSLPFTRRPARRALRFSEAGLGRWMVARGR